MPTNNNIDARSLAVYFKSDASNQISIDEMNSPDLSWNLRQCTTWDELSNVIREKPEMICFHLSMVTNAGLTVSEFVNMIETLLKLTNSNTAIPLCVAIEKTTAINLVKELQKTSVMGFVPCFVDFGVDEARRAIDAIINCIPYWPKHILQQLPGAIKTVTKNTITLTQRQSEISELITSRGLSNKRIAIALNIAESTVKIHVSAILKAYGVRTRTQLAVVANK